MLRRPPTRIELKPEDIEELEGTCVCWVVGERGMEGMQARMEHAPIHPPTPSNLQPCSKSDKRPPRSHHRRRLPRRPRASAAVAGEEGAAIRPPRWRSASACEDEFVEEEEEEVYIAV